MSRNADLDELAFPILRMRTLGTRKRSLCILALSLLVTLAVPSQAAVVTFLGMDNGVGPGDPRPVSNAAAAAFGAAAGLFSTINFESAPVGLFGSLVVAPGVTVTLTNADPAPSPCLSGACGGISNVDQHSVTTPLGFNTTLGGTKFLQVWPNFNSAAGETVTFSFAIPIFAFGSYLSDTQSGFPGPVTLTFNDGSMQVLPITKNDDTGGVLFFGFTDIGKAISSVSYNTGATGTTRDIWGIDDVRFATVPEPRFLGAFGTAILLAGVLRSRRRGALKKTDQSGLPGEPGATPTSLGNPPDGQI